MKSVGHGITTVQDLENNAEVWNLILALSQDIGHKLRVYNKNACGVAIYVRYMHCGAEVEIEWKGKEFGIWSDRNTIRITSIGSVERKFNSVDDALEYIICGDRLRDVITQVTVIDRTI